MVIPAKRNFTLIEGIWIGLQTPIKNGLEKPTSIK
jgi:hypothetical protein